MSGYYGNWQERIYRCRHCDWQGPGAQCPQGELYSGLVGHDCPRCAEEIFVVELPTLREMKAQGDKLSDADKLFVELSESFSKEFAVRSLQSPDQLPELGSETLVLTWDIEDERQGGDTLIKDGERIVWREPAIYEGYERFEEVAQILKQKYKERLHDLVPTLSSTMYLYGDRMIALGTVEEARKKLSQPAQSSPSRSEQ